MPLRGGISPTIKKQRSRLMAFAYLHVRSRLSDDKTHEDQMKRSISGAIMGLILATSAGSLTSYASGSPTISLKSSGPHTITASTGEKCKSESMISFSFRVAALRFSPATKTKSAVQGAGHIQIYLDGFPANAYTKFSRTHWLASIAGTRFSLCFPLAVLGGKRGKHTLFFALGKTNSVLYRVKPVKVTFTAK
jgi:hypothetical protein